MGSVTVSGLAPVSRKMELLRLTPLDAWTLWMQNKRFDDMNRGFDEIVAPLMGIETKLNNRLVFKIRI